MLEEILPNFVLFLLASSFIKIFVTLTILRFGLGLNSWEFGISICALSIALTAFSMDSRQLKTKDFKEYSKSITPFLRSNVEAEIYQRLSVLRQSKNPEDKQIKDTSYPLEVQPDPEVNVQEISQAKPNIEEESDFNLLLASFMVTQLKEAFKIGFIILIPFLVIDVLICNILLMLGARSVAPEILAVPIKILLFFSVDGWTLIAEKLIKEFN